MYLGVPISHLLSSIYIKEPDLCRFECTGSIYRAFQYIPGGLNPADAAVSRQMARSFPDNLD
jgi:hypothetical protein